MIVRNPSTASIYLDIYQPVVGAESELNSTVPAETTVDLIATGNATIRDIMTSAVLIKHLQKGKLLLVRDGVVLDANATAAVIENAPFLPDVGPGTTPLTNGISSITLDHHGRVTAITDGGYNDTVAIKNDGAHTGTSTFEEVDCSGISSGSEFHSAGGHLKFKSDTNDALWYFSGVEQFQVTRHSGGDTHFTSQGGSKGFSFNGPTNLESLKINGTAITATAATLNYVDVTSSVQTLLNAKAPLADPDFTGTVHCANLTATDKIIAEKFEAEGHLKLYSGGTNDMIVYLNSTEAMQTTLSGTQVRFTSSGGSGDFRFNDPVTMVEATAMTDGSDPTAVSGFSHIYSKSGEAFVQDQSGNVTQISPHNDEGEWEYYSKNTKTGKTVRINMEAMIRDLEQLTGKTYIEDV